MIATKRVMVMGYGYCIELADICPICGTYVAEGCNCNVCAKRIEENIIAFKKKDSNKRKFQ